MYFHKFFFAGASFSSNVIIFLDERVLQPKSCHHSRCIAGSSFRSLSNIPHCCLLMESGPYLSPSVADHPLRPTKDLRLGQPLPNQLPNPTRAYLIVIYLIFFFMWYYYSIKYFTYNINSYIINYII